MTGTVGWPGQARRAELLVAAAAVFLVLTTAAMLAHPGGAKYALGSSGYRFFQNFFSDLGATRTYSGRSNTTSHILFLIALACVGLAMMGFATTWRAVAARRGEGRRFGVVAQAAGIVSGIGVCLLALQVRNAWPAAFVALYVLVLFAGPALGTKSGLEFQVAAQKAIVYSSILNLAAQAAGIRREARSAGRA